MKLTFPFLWATRYRELNFNISFYVTGQCGTFSMISIKCLPISTTIIHREKNPSAWYWREGHTVQKMQLHLDSACRPTCLKQPITLCLDVKICYLIRVSHRGRKLHSPSILIQTFLAAALPAVQILAAVYRLNTEILQPSLL